MLGFLQSVESNRHFPAWLVWKVSVDRAGAEVDDTWKLRAGAQKRGSRFESTTQIRLSAQRDRARYGRQGQMSYLRLQKIQSGEEKSMSLSWGSENESVPARGVAIGMAVGALLWLGIMALCAIGRRFL